MTRIDFLFIRRSPLPNEAFFVRRTGFRLPLLLVPIAVICIGWYVFSADYRAASREEFQTPDMTIDERMQWSNLHDVIDGTVQAETLDDAISRLTHLIYVVGHLPYRDDRHERDANGCLDTAENRLLACHIQGRTHPTYWRTDLSNALSTIPRYAGRLDNTPPPPTIDGE